MNNATRILLTTLIAVAWMLLSLACAVGLMATLEPMDSRSKVTWQIVYAGAMLTLLVLMTLGIWLLWRPTGRAADTEDHLRRLVASLPHAARARLLDDAYARRTPWPVVIAGVVSISGGSLLGMWLGRQVSLAMIPAGTIGGTIVGMATFWIILRSSRRPTLIRHLRSLPKGWSFQTCPACGRDDVATRQSCPDCGCPLVGPVG